MSTAVEFKDVDIIFGDNSREALAMAHAGVHRSEILAKTGAVLGATGANLSVNEGEISVLMGLSGSGKSTFMNVIGCLDEPTAGTYRLDGIDVSSLSRDALAEIRNQKIGFVFQGFNLLARTTALENVEVPLLYNKDGSKNRRERALEALRTLGLEDRRHHHPNQLSGGQQQRVAIARALVNNAPLILADEPTGNLDTKTSIEIMDLFVRLNEEKKITIVLVTHEPDISTYSKRIIHFLDGKLVSDEANRR